MIIGISGKIGSGKDTAGKIIQYLNCPILNEKVEIESWINNPDYTKFSPNFKIKRFGDNLKRIAAILLNVNVENFENEIYKSSILPVELRRYYFQYYKFMSGNNPHGKVSRYFSTHEEALEYQNELSGKNDPTSCILDFCNLVYENMTVRKFLQYLGTDAIRNIIHPNIWVYSLFTDYNYDNNTNSYPNWIITDVRFPNELKAIKDRKGFIIRINRDNNSDKVNNGNIDNIRYIDSSLNHSSEISLDNAEFDYVIDNNGTIKELIRKLILLTYNF